MIRIIAAFRAAIRAFRMSLLGYEVQTWGAPIDGGRYNKFTISFHHDPYTQKPVGYRVSSGGVTYSLAFQTPEGVARASELMKSQI